MRLTRTKLFRKSPLYGHRDYFVLSFRKIFYSSTWVLFLHYHGDSSSKLNELRYLAAHDEVQAKLLLRRWVSSIFVNNRSNRHWIPLEATLLVLYSETPRGLLNLLQRPQFQAFLECFPFCGLSCQGLISQECSFASLLEQLPTKSLVALLQSLPLQLIFLWYNLLQPLLSLVAIIATLPQAMEEQ